MNKRFYKILLVVGIASAVGYSFLVFVASRGTVQILSTIPVTHAQTETPFGGSVPTLIISPSSITEGDTITVSGTATGGGFAGEDCEKKPVPATADDYNITVGGPGGSYALTQTEAGLNATSCTNPGNPYEYTYNFTVSTTGLAPGSYTMNVCIRSAGAIQTCGTSDFTVAATTAVPPTISLVPPTANLGEAGTKTFTATINGTPSTAITWFVNGIAGGNATLGKIAAVSCIAGLPTECTAVYTAPGTITTTSTVTVKATLALP